MSSNSTQLQLARLALSGLPPGEIATLISEYAAKREEIVLRLEVAAQLRRTPRTIDDWARKGLLVKVRVPGLSRAVGFRRSDVDRLLAWEGSLTTPSGIVFTPRMKPDGKGGWICENPDYVNRMMGRTKNGAGGGSSQ